MLSHHAFTVASEPASVSGRMRRITLCLAAFTFLALCLSAPARSSEPVAGPFERIYLFVPCESPVDVTGTVYTQQGQTYAVYLGDTIPIVLNHEEGHVFDMSAHLIGFISEGGEPPS